MTCTLSSSLLVTVHVFTPGRRVIVLLLGGRRSICAIAGIVRLIFTCLSSLRGIFSTPGRRVIVFTAGAISISPLSTYENGEKDWAWIPPTKMHNRIPPPSTRLPSFLSLISPHYLLFLLIIRYLMFNLYHDGSSKRRRL